MKDELFLVVELIGIIAFSISGAVTAYRKQMDLFGIMILGACTALGGGVLRDMMLGIIAVLFLLPIIYNLLTGKKKANV